jgi:uridylate kinase
MLASYQRNGFTRCLRDKGMLTCIKMKLLNHISKEVRHLEKGRIVILDRNRKPYFTTDTAAVL